MTTSGGDTRLNQLFLWLNLEKKYWINDIVRWELGMVRRRQLKKVITLQSAMTKKGRQFFKEKIGDTIS